MRCIIAYEDDPYWKVLQMSNQVREIVIIDDDKCDGCGVCVPSCAEGAIQIIDGKAMLVGENLCDGLGNCLGQCPKDAITIETRQADDFDEQAVEAHLAELDPKPAAVAGNSGGCPSGGCPGSMMRDLSGAAPATATTQPAQPAPKPAPATSSENPLSHWPVQLTLLPEQGPIWQRTDVVLAADCAAFAMRDFHSILDGKTLAIACPKLDDAQSYVTKLARIFASNDIKSITIVRMEVPCCGGLEMIVQKALENVGKAIPVKAMIISVTGKILNEH